MLRGKWSFSFYSFWLRSLPASLWRKVGIWFTHFQPSRYLPEPDQIFWRSRISRGCLWTIGVCYPAIVCNWFFYEPFGAWLHEECIFVCCWAFVLIYMIWTSWNLKTMKFLSFSLYFVSVMDVLDVPVSHLWQRARQPHIWAAKKRWNLIVSYVNSEQFTIIRLQIRPFPGYSDHAEKWWKNHFFITTLCNENSKFV